MLGRSRRGGVAAAPGRGPPRPRVRSAPGAVPADLAGAYVLAGDTALEPMHISTGVAEVRERRHRAIATRGRATEEDPVLYGVARSL